MKSKNKSAGFALVEGLIILAVIAAVGVGGWYVYSQRNDKSSNSNQTQNTQDNKKDTETLSVEIPDLGLKINDPDSRHMSVEKVDVKSPYDNSSSTVYVVTPEDYKEEYKKVCEEPSYIHETTADDTSTNAKKVGEKYYIIGKTIMGCGGSAEMSQYIDELHTYIVNNIATL